jgi:hypothetical protein
MSGRLWRLAIDQQQRRSRLARTKSHIFGTEVGADDLFSPSTIAGVALADDAGARRTL